MNIGKITQHCSIFSWIRRQSKETENRDTAVYRCCQDSFVHIRKIMVQFFFGILRTKSEPIGEEKSEQERDEWFPTRTKQSFYDYNNFTNFWTVHVHWQMWAFKTKLRSNKFLLAFQSNILLKNTGPNSREAFIRVKMVWNFFCISRGNLRAALFWPGLLRIQGH